MQRRQRIRGVRGSRMKPHISLSPIAITRETVSCAAHVDGQDTLLGIVTPGRGTHGGMRMLSHKQEQLELVIIVGCQEISRDFPKRVRETLPPSPKRQATAPRVFDKGTRDIAAITQASSHRAASFCKQG
ncbi:unnamed protein product [Cochlearia groenlandica]